MIAITQNYYELRIQVPTIIIAHQNKTVFAANSLSKFIVILMGFTILFIRSCLIFFL
ncbi:hypothetical protein NARC_40018 [Candidatus Nitrosocosmicus arcticus]|uniref:Uncharacterized protein n=1 Tax=Candidatus Nitrosocosmicus arcticus TaxID=2035267 RepID=A0A557SWS4_9ARCH|nr:hypothetical protein NARC_40018 [Candidatus Nitrosocosmicus arcticus]